tara:strand:- start:885 stop:2579 length:1695 start_codon:yes stop_codon:yes gene_type:complete
MVDKSKNNKDFYLGNKNLPTERAQFEYTPEMVRKLKKAGQNLLFFAENYFYIVNLDTGRQTIKLHRCQKRALRNMRDNRFVVMLASRQCGKTTMMTIYALWNACFNKDQRVLVVANKEGTAIEIFQRIRLAYEELPNWLKPGVKEYGKTSMTLANGSRIGISTTTGTAARGQSVNCLILDELAFIDPHLVEPFWNSVYPIISSSKKSKIFIASTPNGTENLFYKLYTGAASERNGWSSERIDWWEVPGRDDAWRDQTIKTMGSEEVFRQEFGNEFLETGESVLDEEILDKLEINITSPVHILEDGCYKLWTHPQPQSRIYVAGVDVGEGVSQASSVVQIFDITDLTHIKQAAIYSNNTISPYNFTSKLHELLQHWGSPLALIERNNCGAQVVDNLAHHFGYENIVTYNNVKKIDMTRLGVLAHTNTKYKGVMNMRYWINELKSVVLYDEGTLYELKNFIRYPNGTWKARDGEDLHDDKVMAMIWSLMILETAITERHFDIERVDDNGKPLQLTPLSFNLQQSTTLDMQDDYMSGSNFLPVMIQTGDDTNSDIAGLKEQGWQFPQ